MAADRWPTDGPPWARWDATLWRFVPFVFAVTTGLQLVKFIVVPQGIGFDARLYTAAARAWLAGGDPWQVADLGVFYAAPPPTLLAFVPFTILPDPVVSFAWIAASLAAAVIALRSLGLQWWWLTFWPIVEGTLVGNPDVIVLALLVVGRGRLAAIAPFLKVYAFIPLVAERRWRPVSVAAVALCLSVPILPWSQWLADLPRITANLAESAQTTSVFGNPILMLIGTVAVLSLGIRRAGWLAIPVLWPSTQPHYMALSVPMLTPLMAIAWSLPTSSMVLVGTVLAALGFRFLPGPDTAKAEHGTVT